MVFIPSDDVSREGEREREREPVGSATTINKGDSPWAKKGY
jgi:hypothetical protein